MYHGISYPARQGVGFGGQKTINQFLFYIQLQIIQWEDFFIASIVSLEFIECKLNIFKSSGVFFVPLKLPIFVCMLIKFK